MMHALAGRLWVEPAGHGEVAQWAGNGVALVRAHRITPFFRSLARQAADALAAVPMSS